MIKSNFFKFEILGCYIQYSKRKQNFSDLEHNTKTSNTKESAKYLYAAKAINDYFQLTNILIKNQFFCKQGTQWQKLLLH